ncbi:HARBI1 [Mytilus edulis]|uniref:HARBI1 n=1 Tax=Mytilus edulis TaxID=6550 RepID=A0A8S3Q6W3_MYTED|nr:HARBI1 [Mytilus edulis]
MSRTPTALEVRMAKQHIRKKFSMEYRPAMYRTLKKNMEMGREPMTRKLFKSFASTLHQTTVNTVGYRKKVVLIMRIVQRRGNIVTGTFWTKVRNLYDSIEEKVPARKLAIYEAFQRKDDRGEGNNKIQIIKFQREEAEQRRVKERFYDISSFPNVLGAFGGTLIPIQEMSGNDEPNYVCRKQYQAINVQAICDAELK